MLEEPVINEEHAIPRQDLAGLPTAAAQVAAETLPRRDRPADDLQAGDRQETAPDDGIVPGLKGISETMLWSLHNRASEARRCDGVLVDPESVLIRSSIHYDFARHFGEPLGSLAARAAEIDRVLRSWLERHPDGTVISLGEGLETQRRRVDNGRMRWLSVDLPDAIRLRERFLAPTDRFRHFAASALDPAWMDAVDPSTGVMIVAQGLLMYLPPEQVGQLIAGIAERFPGAELVFDAIPRWLSRLTLLGLYQTAYYRLPSMPWGIDRNEVEPTLRRWHARVASIVFLSYRMPRGLPRLLAGIISQIPVARHGVPSLVHVTISEDVGRSAVAGAPESENREAAEPVHLTPFGTPDMISHHDHDSPADAMRGFFAAARQNATCHHEIAIAATHVISCRVRLGMAAAVNPLRADRAEFSRMVPEKVEAFSTAGMIMLRQSGRANRHIMRLASNDVMTTALDTIEMTGSRSPIALAEAHIRFARSWFVRTTSLWMALGIGAFGAQAAAMAPVRQAVVANAERLGR